MRELGETLAISIGTALALEVLVKEDKSKYTHVWLNIRTLIRNYIEAHPKWFETLKPEDMPGCVKEIQDIKAIMENKFKLVLYLPDIDNLPAALPFAKLKYIKTDRQKRFKVFTDLVIRELATSDIEILKVMHKLKPGSQSNTVILTHSPIDLLSVYEFKSLDLISSHTGVIKSKLEWIQTLTRNPAYYDLPFNILTLQLIGDKANLFYSMPMRVIAMYKDLSVLKKWTIRTTLTKIKSDISKMKDKAVGDVMIKMARTNLK